MDLGEAYERVVRTIEDTRAAALDGYEYREDAGNGEDVSCTDREGAPSGAVYRSYGLVFDIDGATARDLMVAVKDRWTSEGYEVDAASMEAARPSIFVESDGYNYRFSTNEARGEAELGGSTPCASPD